MHNIQEQHLQHLQLFTEYGRLVLEQTNKKPFQYLVFLVRDWQYAYEIDYGMYGHEVIDDILAKDDEQTAEMRELRKQINSSFDEIGAFLMPHPGFAVTQQPNFTGNLKEIHPDFIKYTKELTLSIFAPENLVVKKINGHEVRARDLIPYLQSYLHLFNGQTLPEPKTVLMATREINHLILSNECIHFYIDYMQKSLNATQSYFSGNELKELHRSAKNKAIELFQTKSKFGTNELILDHQKRIEIDIEDKFNIFHLENDKMYRNYIETAKLFNEKMVNTIKAKTYSQIIDRINTKLNLSDFELLSSFEELKNTALKRFNDEKLGDHDIFNIFREKLEYDLNHLRLLLEQMLIFSEHSMESYVSCMQKSIKQIQTYFNETEFTQLHQSTKNHSMYQFQEKFGCDDLASSMQRRFQTNIGKEFLFFKQQNEIKRVEFIKKANAHNERLIQEIKAVIEEGAQAEILRTHFNEYDLNGLFLGMKDVGLEMFDAQKICDGGISKIFREKLNQDLSKLWNTLTQRNRRRNTIRIG
ncbi:atlastin-like [Contarinia nasturtii]|uniref:atlastin-like n=1 Tax=Contarinia nasturtii TaxID=265458 RepID=UPI0012D447E9|nr:atlastin-like [Contarinia nasturtii]